MNVKRHIRRQFRHPFWVSCVCVGCAILFMGRFSHGETAIQPTSELETSSAELAKKYADLYQKKAKLKASKELQRRPTDISARESRNPGDLIGIDTLPKEFQGAFATVLYENADPVIQQINIIASEQKEEIQRLHESLIGVRTQGNRIGMQNADFVAQSNIKGQVATMIRDNRWFWLSGVIALAALAYISWHDRRHEYRRRLNGAKARSLGIASILQYSFILLGVFTLVVFQFGDTIYRRLTVVNAENNGGTINEKEVRSRDLLQREIEMLDKDCENLKKEIEERQSSGTYPISTKPGAAIGLSFETEKLNNAWTVAEEKVREVLRDIKIRDSLREALQIDLATLTSLEKFQVEHDSAIKSQDLKKYWARSTIGLALIGISLGSGYLFLRSAKRRNAEISNTCPMCLGVDTLEVDATGDGGRGGVEMVKCNNVFSQDPYEECDFKFHGIYRDMPKLCFPTLGHPQSGKTHWLAMTYRQLNQGNYQANVQFDKVKSSSSDDFDRIVDEIINSRMNPGATMSHRIPHPVLFNFGDRDRYGKSNLLVSIFDYSGEVTQGMSLRDHQRQRALNADGYLFFLDPTAQSDDQVKELINFREDVRVIRKSRSGQAICAPVALCVSKIDLLINQPYADQSSDGVIGRFYKEIAAADPSGSALSLDVIEKRSELIKQLRDTIWPGWQIERQINDLFGGRCMFFPLTPVGLTDIGETDLRVRQIEPFAILEPLMWLLHMNGYPVLD